MHKQSDHRDSTFAKTPHRHLRIVNVPALESAAAFDAAAAAAVFASAVAAVFASTAVFASAAATPAADRAH